MQVWANADYPRDAERARAFGAQGIGLCRTEHMFFEGDRLPTVQRMILNAHAATAAKHKADADGPRRSASRSRPSTPPWPRWRSSRPMTSPGSSGPWTACRSSSA